MNAGFGRRLAALIYDAFLSAALLMAFTAATLFLSRGRAVIESNVGAWIYPYRAGLLAVVATYFAASCATTGHTLGMRAWRLQLVDRIGNRVSFSRALWRFAIAVPAWCLGGLGVFWLYADRQRCALQDRLSQTRVIVLPK